MRAIVLFLLDAWLLCFSWSCLARDILNAGEKITVEKTLVSSGNQFELGFFSTPESTVGIGTGRYLGIWYYRPGRSAQLTVVWVANRDDPVDVTGVFQIAEDGNLVVVDTSGKRYWSSKLVEDSSSKNRTVTLMDSGNLVLIDEHLGRNLWQSFQHPTDTFLPGMKMDKDLELTCWRGPDDPGKGNFTFKMAQTSDNRFVILNQNQLYWQSEKRGESTSEATSDDMIFEVYSLLTNFTELSGNNSRNLKLTDYRNVNARVLMSSAGLVQFVLRANFHGEFVKWYQPKSNCSTYNACGEFASCNDNRKPICNCLPGFNPISTPKGHSGDFPQDMGCARKSASCGNDTTFINLVMMKIGSPDKQVTVANESECRSECLNRCSQCQAYSYAAPSTRRDLSPSTCWIWTQGLPTLKEEYLAGDGRNLSVRVDKSDIDAPSLRNPTLEEPTRKGNSKSPLSLILGITLAGVFILACTIIFAYVCRQKIGLQQDGESIQRNRGCLYDSERHVKDLIDKEGLEEKDNEGIEVPYFDFESILVATDHFSDANKLGRGGYGPVYKGKLQGGQDIAVKRLSSASSQGLQEFKNEVVLIAKLQHRNLVRLRGYCIKGDEKILLYEYMPNKSLDLFLFDQTQSILLDWSMRFDITLGVARGLLYLHQDSRLRVIHRDLKTSNILLDGEMQPKISDFGLARIFESKETERSTERVVGTYGYMSPEYALDGLFSIKSDVFSFGVVLLEIISGKKNMGFYQSKQVSSLLGHAWRLWTENKLLDLMDLSLRETCNANQFIRCAHIGLLCVQDEPGDRPTMSNVVIMLESETATLPTPKQPTFFASKDISSTASSSKAGLSVQFESSLQEGR